LLFLVSNLPLVLKEILDVLIDTQGITNRD